MNILTICLFIGMGTIIALVPFTVYLYKRIIKTTPKDHLPLNFVIGYIEIFLINIGSGAFMLFCLSKEEAFGFGLLAIAGFGVFVVALLIAAILIESIIAIYFLKRCGETRLIKFIVLFVISIFLLLALFVYFE